MLQREGHLSEDVITNSYQELVQHVASRPEWKSALFDELPTCIAVLSDLSAMWRLPTRSMQLARSDFISVLQNIWAPSFPQLDGQQQQIQFTTAGQQCTALCLVALFNVWEGYDAAKLSLEQFLQLVRCTVSTALLTWDWILSPLEGDFEPAFTSRLCSALAQATANARHSTEVGVPGGRDAGASQVEIHPARRRAELLETLAHKLEIEFNRPDRGRDTLLRDRVILRDELEAEIKAWEESLGHGEEED
ncbi:hypothetical protein B0H16DRAFT_894593 [Mycena metata]|uniref:Uncharacterized protein n=1 Tax=Mycena metata TaxID=1033252 RepID=A0AAD7GL11_9AGAR|nr:hypothetical protein B0H16DRAFT_894593 [Mycena metata]